MFSADCFMMVTSVTRMEIMNEVTEVLLNITMDIIHLLTGEDYAIVEKKSGVCRTSSRHHNISAGLEKSPPRSVIHENNNAQKILELTHKMIELLSGEVPIRCQDVAVYFSMEEWEYIEGHKDRYQDVVMDDHQNLTASGELHNHHSSHDRVSCFSSESNISSSSYVEDELETSQNDTKVLLDEGSDSTSTDEAQYPLTHVMEEPVSCHEDPVTHAPTDHTQPSAAEYKDELDVYIPTDDTELYLSTQIMEESALCDEEDEENPQDMYTDSNPIQHVLSPCIKEEPVSCDEEDLPFCDIYTQHDLSLHFKEEPTSCEEDLAEANSYKPSDHLLYLSPEIKEEPTSCEEDLAVPKNYTSSDHLLYISPHIKEEPTSCEEDLAEPNNFSNLDRSHYLSPEIKEEPTSCEEDLAEPNTSSPLDRSHYLSPHIKEEPDSCEEDLAEANSYTPSDHLHYSSPHIKEKPTSCDDLGRYTYSLHTLEHQYACIKKEPDFDNDIIHPESYTRHPSPYVKEEPSSCGGGSISYSTGNTPTHCTQQYLTTHSKKEPASFTERDFPVSYRVKYQSRHVKEEPSCRDNGRYQSSVPCEEPITSHLRYRKETDLPSSSGWAHNLPPTSKDDVTIRHPDVKPEKSPSPVKVIVMAHLVDVDRTTESNIRHNSQSPQYAASTSSRVRHEPRLSYRSHPRPMPSHEAGATFGDISNLTKYLRTHSKKKTPQCLECGKYFLRKVLLDAHLRMHAKQRPLQCADCGICFLDNVQPLDRKRHPGEMGYRCPDCRNQCNDKTSQRRKTLSVP